MKVSWRFGVTFRLHVQGRRVSQAKNQHEAGSKVEKVITPTFLWTDWLDHSGGNMLCYAGRGEWKGIHGASVCILNMVNKGHFVLHLHALVYLPFFRLFIVAKYFRENIRGSPGLVSDHPCENPPITRIQPQRLRNGECLLSQSQSYFTTGGLPPISLSWRRASWGLWPEFLLLFQLNPCGHSPCVISSLTRGFVCLLWICLAFVKCTSCLFTTLWSAYIPDDRTLHRSRCDNILIKCSGWKHKCLYFNLSAM
jgi:hypothetical protein